MVLGKTIVAGIVTAQRWAEGKRKILIIVLANLLRQWQMELEEKFYLPSVILYGGSFNEYINSGVQNPFDNENIIITSYNFAHLKSEYIKAIEWDMAVCDEVHKLRNAYKSDNVIARSIRGSLGDCFKMLLTATPLQNSLLELYGLISFIDDYTFGDVESFKSQFLYLKDNGKHAYDDLVSRLKTVCIRTLRRQVLEYIRYTERLPITQEFVPTPAEQEFYDKFSRYIQRDNLWALPNSGRHLMSLILWKLLASSTFAIAGTINTFIERLEAMLASEYNGANLKTSFYDEMSLPDYEDEPEIQFIKRKTLTEKDKVSLQREIDELREYYNLASSITQNAKGEALLIALEKGFEKLKSLKAPQKAVIFTESRRTQEYIASILNGSKFNKFVLFHGSLNTAEKRQRVIDEFQDSTQIMIATDSAAEGLNLHFSSMVINYDLPFNP